MYGAFLFLLYGIFLSSKFSYTPPALFLVRGTQTLLAVAISSQSYMKLIFVRILMPSASPSTSPERRQSSGQRVTQALHARADLGIHNRKDAAILAQSEHDGATNSIFYPAGCLEARRIWGLG
ncbi:hypothetical protein ACJ73_06547 [Blastomyces percursus]|uniref:Uncharacterized protein n=1 Tax=Blastomyces percursus TaxID=1658174 RepID=A0A1J9R0V7_9EURO|nr:hypothetical protein ACJ73_06547 [Blastomyces percursus]